MPGSNKKQSPILNKECFTLKLESFVNRSAYLQDDLKATLTARNREAKQLSQLERTRQRNPSDRHVIVSFGF